MGFNPLLSTEISNRDSLHLIKFYSIFIKREVVSKLFFSKFDGIGHLSFLEYFEEFL